MHMIKWIDLNYSSTGEPWSPQFNDRYFSCGEGLAESEYVFFAANGLPALWQGRSRFYIAEIGFGTGLNFFLARKKWNSTRRAGEELHFFSFEKYPIYYNDLKAVFSQILKCPELIPDQFLLDYQKSQAGWNVITFPNEHLVLHLYLGDALKGIRTGIPKQDVWFYDGFSPSRNPELWDPKIFNQLAEHSRVGTKISTFTSVGKVKRGLISVGFQMEIIEGFGRKRNMLRGVFSKVNGGVIS